MLSPIGVAAQTILIDGVKTYSLSGETCGKSHNLECVLPTAYPSTNYCMWQRSDDDGATWTNMPQSGQDVYSIDVTNDNGGKQLYHVLITTTLESALNLEGGPIAVSENVSLECNLSICGENENRLVVWKEDFKSTPRGERRECADVQNRKFAGQYNLEYATNINDNKYAIVSHSEDGSIPQYNWFSGGTDHTGNKDGGFLLINNPDGVGNEHILIFEKTIDFDLCPDTWYYFSMYAMCVTGGFARDPNAQGAYPNFMFEIIGADGVTVLESGLSGEVPVAAYGISTWINYGISFNAGNNKNVILRIYDDAKKGVPGDDMAIDDISLIACQKEIPATNLNAGLSPDADGICGDSTTLTLSEMSQWEKTYPNVYVVWQKSLDGGFTWITIPGANGEKSYSLRAPFEESTYGVRYRAVIAKDETTANFIAENGYSDDACSIYMITNVSTLTCHCEKPEISLSFKDTAYCLINNETIEFNISVTNDVNVDTFYWMSKTEPDAKWTPIATLKESSLMGFPVEPTYFAVFAISGECVSDTDSCVVRVMIPDTLSIPLEGKDSICENEETELSLNLSLSRQVSWWAKKAGEPSFSLVTKDGPSYMANPDMGDSYYAFVDADQQSCKAYISDTMSFYIEYPVYISETQRDHTICEGTTVELTATATSSSVVGYRWTKRSEEGTIVLAESNKTQDIPTADCEYLVTYITEVCPSVNDSVKFKIVRVDDLSLTASTDIICENGEVTLTADFGTMTDVIWEQMPIHASEFSTLSSDLTQTMKVQPDVTTTYRIKSSANDVCPEYYSDPITIQVEDSIHLKVEPTSATIEKGEPLHLEAFVSGDASSFVWQKETGDNVETLSAQFEIDDTPDTDCEYIATAKGEGCPGVSLTIPVIVEYTNELVLSTSVDTICSGETVELTASLDNATNVKLYAKGEESSDFEAISPNITSNKITITPQKNTEYQLREEGKENYSNIVTIYVGQPAEAKLTGPDMSCPNGEITLNYFASSDWNLLAVSLLETTADTSIEHKLLEDRNNTIDISISSGITFTPTQETRYTLVVNTPHCPTQEVSHTVGMYEIPGNYSLTISADTLCEDDPVTITTDFPFSTGNLSLSYWRTDIHYPTETIIMTSNSETIIPTGSSMFALTPRTEDGCLGEVQKASVKVYASVKATTNDTVICEGEPASLRVYAEKTDYSYIWSQKADFSDTVGVGDMISITPDKDETYHVKVINGKCEKELETAVHVISMPEIELTGKDIICPNSELTLQYKISSVKDLTKISIEESEAGNVFEEKILWDNTMESENGLNGEISFSPKQETEYTLSASCNQCPKKTVSHPVKIAEVPTDYTLTASADSICEGENVTITTDFPFSPDKLVLSTWISGNTNLPSEEKHMESQSEIIQPNGTSKLVLTPTTEEGCVAEERSVTVTVFTHPKGATKDTTICEGESTLLHVDGAEPGQTLTWSLSADFSDILSSDNNVSVTPTEDATYYVKLAQGKCEDTLKQTIHVVTAPEIDLDGDDVVCPDNELTLRYKVSSTTDVSKIFMSKYVEGNVIGDSTLWDNTMEEKSEMDEGVSFVLNQGTEFTLSIIPNHCPEQKISHEVKIAQIPTDYTLTISEDSICMGDPVTITTDFPFSPNKLLLSTWNPEDTDQPSEKMGMESQTETVYPSTYGTIRYVLTPYTEEGCAAEERSVSVLSFKPIEDVTKDTTVCDGDAAVLQVYATETGHSYTWSHFADFSDTISLGKNITITPTEETTYHVKDVNGKCEKVMEQTIHIATHPAIELEKELHAVTCLGVGGSGDYTYDFGKGFSTDNKLQYAMPGASYSVRVKDGRGCVGDTTFEMEYEELIIPEFFTPQGDGLNDKWEIVNLDKYEHVRVSIFDRFGKKIYETEDADESWDGTYNGNPLPSADYWYLIYIMDIEKHFKGHFTLIRSK